MENKPTYNEIIDLPKKKDILHALCIEHNVSFKKSHSTAELKNRLITALDLKEEEEEKKIAPKDSALDQTEIGFDNISTEGSVQQKKVSLQPSSLTEEKAKEIPLSVKGNSFSKFHMPVTNDELVQFWQRGFICHPAILAHLTGGNSVEHEKSDIANLSHIDLEKDHQSECSIHLELNKEFIRSSVIDEKWIVPITALRSIKVRSEEDEEIALRSLRNTNRGFNVKGIKIIMDDQKFKEHTKNIDGSSIEIKNETIKEFKRLTSLMGGFAISSHIEREELLQGRHFTTSLSRFGSLFEGAFESQDKKFKKKLLDFIVEKLKANLNRDRDQSSQYFDDLLDDLSLQDDSSIIKKVLDQNSSKLDSTKFLELREALQENLVRKILDEIVPKGPRDPFLIFISLLNQFSNTKVPAASDKQSFLFAIKDFKKEGVLSQEEAIVVGFLLGYYLGYGRCWNPVRKKKIEEWSLQASNLDLLYEPLVLQVIIESLIEATSLDYQFNRIDMVDKNFDEEVIKSNRTSTRSMRITAKKITLKDACLEKFLRWKGPSKDISLMNLFLYQKQHKNTEDKIRALFESVDNTDEVFQRIESDLTRGKFSDPEREVITKMIESSI
jgi:hypothetical protein